MNLCSPKVKNFAKRTQREYYVEHFDNDTEVSMLFCCNNWL